MTLIGMLLTLLAGFYLGSTIESHQCRMQLRVFKFLCDHPGWWPARKMRGLALEKSVYPFLWNLEQLGLVQIDRAAQPLLYRSRLKTP
jgi:hypothetical protein